VYYTPHASVRSSEGEALPAEGREEVAPLDEQQRLPPPPLPSEWLTRPMMLRVACGATAGEQVGFNQPGTVFPVETPLFSGHCYVRFRGLPNEPSAYFAGKKRHMSTVVQGRVKQPLPLSECATGFEFDAPLRKLPGRTLINLGLGFIRTIAPAVSVDLGDRPTILNPLLQTVQRLHVAQPGEEPEITDPFDERTALLGGKFAERSVSWKDRKKFFASRANAGAYTLDPRLVYTFEFYEDKLVPATFDFMIIGMRFPLARFLGCGKNDEAPAQPLQTMAKLGFEPHTRCFLFNIEMWHESLFPKTTDSDSGSATSATGRLPKAERAEVEVQEVRLHLTHGNDHTLNTSH
jgi:hypothetical protein